MIHIFVFICGLLYLAPNKYKLILLKSKSINLGTLNVDELTLIEWKPLFSLKTFYFHEGTAQEIFHTHNFNALSLLLYGNYIELFYDEKTNFIWEESRNRSIVILIPRERFHQITKSTGCRTIMITGPWGDTYKEYNSTTREIIVSTHGRNEIARYSIN